MQNLIDKKEISLKTKDSNIGKVTILVVDYLNLYYYKDSPIRNIMIENISYFSIDDVNRVFNINIEKILSREIKEGDQNYCLIFLRSKLSQRLKQFKMISEENLRGTLKFIDISHPKISKIDHFVHWMQSIKS